MRMTIKRMVIENFKGCRSLKVDFGEMTRISGMNGTGKSTVPDAFCWVLFNKDSRGNNPGTYDFHEKPLDAEGNEIHNLDTTVELDCRLDGQRFNLKRTQRENWVKKRGAMESVYQGNVSTYWINDVEIKLTDFKARIAQITSEDVFRLIGTLSAFNCQLDQKKRREHLIALSDQDVDAMLFQRDQYQPLAHECAQRGVAINEYRKILADQRKRANDELKMLPVRIDEARKALPGLTEEQIKDAEYVIADAMGDIDCINARIAEEKAKSGSTGIQDQIAALESEAASLQRSIADKFRFDQKQLEQARCAASETYRRASEALVDARRRMEREKAQWEKAVTVRDGLRSDYTAAYERKFTPPRAEGICPTCGQALPADQIQAAAEKAKQEFMAARKATLADIKARGIEAAGAVKQSEELLNRYAKDVADLEKQVQETDAARDCAYERIRQFPQSPDYSSEPRIAELRKQINDLQAMQITAPSEKIEGYEQRKQELNAIVIRNQAILAKRDAGIEVEKRIAALEAEQREKAIQVSEIEHMSCLLEQFIRDRCAALEDSINAKFPSVRWKLFETQINGGINDVCQAYIPCGGSLVSYGSANTAAQVNIDIEIINVLSRHYDTYLPIFADNAERVNTLAQTDSQFISLAVTDDAELKIETTQKEEAA